MSLFPQEEKKCQNVLHAHTIAIALTLLYGAFCTVFIPEVNKCMLYCSNGSCNHLLQGPWLEKCCFLRNKERFKLSMHHLSFYLIKWNFKYKECGKLEAGSPVETWQSNNTNKKKYILIFTPVPIIGSKLLSSIRFLPWIGCNYIITSITRYNVGLWCKTLYVPRSYTVQREMMK